MVVTYPGLFTAEEVYLSLLLRNLYMVLYVVYEENIILFKI